MELPHREPPRIRVQAEMIETIGAIRRLTFFDNGPLSCQHCSADRTIACDVKNPLAIAVHRSLAKTATQIEFPMHVAVCAWCRPKAAGPPPPGQSHGICPRHLKKMRAQLSKALQKKSKNPAK